ncbi:WS/DGAT/MGAT family O-acyltransferase [Gordonia aquimaris]|uniref:Diacylglycerol O-acyltransferase n=1 Tax=Gordonia aquimaris TaxID=2984863 RepID=A0A9X3D6E1_9ACTN|nr:wax ester/triacylglycerol synthase family O-acyltransferase [Gordonia aquimaris]MCX2965783.1 wax ester/triacylglycerol synthase family O-acyltransferase [Gordonia aquimaris]
MPYMPVTESMFLIAETREQPMHAGGLQLFIPREGQSATELAEEIVETFHSCADIRPLFRKRPASPAALLGTLAWSYDDEIDVDYHVRRAVLPRPGRIRELLRYVSLNHSALLDRTRPMWELHIIEGLDDGRVAIYTKIHHSLVDGISALRLLENSLSPDPNDRTGTAWWDTALLRRRPPRETTGASLRSRLTAPLGQALNLTGQIVGAGPAAAKIAWAGITDDAFAPPFVPAPNTILDVPIGSARRFAAQQWPRQRLDAVGQALDITLNDVVVTMCAGALRAYLIDQDALPDDPLIAAMPVSTRTDKSSEGNAVTAIMANLATDQPDPERRLAAVIASTRKAKQVIRGLSPLQALAFGAATFAPLALAPIPGFVRSTPPQFNVLISNVPGPSRPMYWNGAALDGCYPVSIAMHGQALNITLTTTADQVNFGLIGARKELPSLQRILTHLDTALDDLEKVAGVRPLRSVP